MNDIPYDLEQHFLYAGSSLGDTNEKPRFVIENADDLEPEQSCWLLKNVLPRVGLAFVAGPPGSGKSFLALELASRVAKGEPMLSHRTKQSTVLYVAAEGANGVKLRFLALRSKVGNWKGKIKFLGQPVNLTNPDQLAALREAIEPFKDDLGLIVIDTLSASLQGADENSGEDMGVVLAHLQELGSACGACVLVIHHTGKDTAKGLRGWSGLHANADAVIFVQAADAVGTRKGTIAKVKDAESGWCFSFALEQREMAPDSDGEPVTSCVVRDLEKSDTDVKNIGEKRSADADVILKAFNGLEADYLPAEAKAGAGKLGTTIETLREAAFINLHAELKDTSSRVVEARWKANRKKAWQRGFDKLIEQKRLCRHGDWVWGTA